MNQRSPIDTQATLLMLLLCSIWSLQQVLLKASSADFSPMLQTSVRCGLGALLVGLFVWFKNREGFTHDQPTLWPGLLAGFMFAAEFLLAALAIELTSVSHLIVLIYTAPIFAALGLALFLPDERLQALQWVGILLAFGGIALAFGEHQAEIQGGLSEVIVGDILALLAGAIWGATTVVVRVTNLSRAPAPLTLIYQLLACFVLLFIYAVWTDDLRFNPTSFVLGTLAFQVIAVSFFSYLTWFWLLKKYYASRLGVFSFLTPLLGVGMSAIILGESVTPQFLIGSFFVVLGITLVSAHAVVVKQLRHFLLKVNR